MKQPFLPYAKQSINDEDIRVVAESLKEELITRGPLVQQFEKALAQYCDVPYAVVFNSGTAALAASYFAAGLSQFDWVISTPNTFIATVGIPIEKRISLFLGDIDPLSGNIDLTKLKGRLGYHSTRGRPFIVPVHFSGWAVDIAKLSRMIAHPDAVIIEDAAHAFGSFYPTGEKVGSCTYSQMTIFSFHPAKVLTTGEGGCVTTRDPELYHRLQLFRNNGIERFAPQLVRKEAPGYYEVQAITGNYNVTSFQAALGLNQLKRVDSFIHKRRALVRRYRENLAGIPHLTLFTDSQDEITAFHLFVIQVEFEKFGTTREKVMGRLMEKGIGTQVHYVPLYYHPVLGKELSSEQAVHPGTETYYRRALSLPLYPDLAEEEVDRVCETLISELNVSSKKGASKGANYRQG